MAERMDRAISVRTKTMVIAAYRSGVQIPSILGFLVRKGGLKRRRPVLIPGSAVDRIEEERSENDCNERHYYPMAGRVRLSVRV